MQKNQVGTEARPNGGYHSVRIGARGSGLGTRVAKQSFGLLAKQSFTLLGALGALAVFVGGCVGTPTVVMSAAVVIKEATLELRKGLREYQRDIAQMDDLAQQKLIDAYTELIQRDGNDPVKVEVDRALFAGTLEKLRRNRAIVDERSQKLEGTIAGLDETADCLNIYGREMVTLKDDYARLATRFAETVKEANAQIAAEEIEKKASRCTSVSQLVGELTGGKVQLPCPADKGTSP